ncbi:MAG TPA: AAA family ATPase [Bryobacteraceae bacterium]|jgi:cellulose biosynthesis protein BcsQ|nr:AAA family ATPase [Bryobacteraceae bacterium]
MKTIAFFNNQGGVGQTTLVYHLAWMFAEMGLDVLAADLDPQSNLTSMFLEEDRLEELWPEGQHPQTIYGVVDPILRGVGDIQMPHVESIATRRFGDSLGLIAGDLALSGFEDKLSETWSKCHNKDESAFRTMTAFYRAIVQAAGRRGAEFILLDVGPNLGAINRAALIASDHVVIPLASDLYSLQGLRNLGPQLRLWREAWGELKTKNPDREMLMPSGNMCASGYVVMQHGTRGERPVKAYLRWMERIPNEYRRSVAGEQPDPIVKVENDPYCLAALKHYRSLMPLAMEARKPMFSLKPADGAIGAHAQAVRDCYTDFRNLAMQILSAVGGARA